VVITARAKRYKGQRTGAFLNVGIKGMKKGSKKAGFSEHL
jgi:hypothetical protein